MGERYRVRDDPLQIINVAQWCLATSSSYRLLADTMHLRYLLHGTHPLSWTDLNELDQNL